MRRATTVALWSVLVGPGLMAPASGQTLGGVGQRAVGMAGAFTAVADDASAVYWNPAGTATGAYASLVVDWLTHESGASDDDRSAPAVRGSGTLVAVTTPVVGAGYYRVATTHLGPIRQRRPGDGPSEVGRDGEALVTDQFVVTLAQTVIDGLHVGAAVKAVRGRAAVAGFSGVTLVLDPERQFGILEDGLGDGATAFDVDVGVMVDARRVRLAMTARNLLEPSFATSTPPAEVALRRRVRAGAAILPSDRVAVAVDADLTTVETVAGRWREVALGAEAWTASRRFGLRGGLGLQTVDASRPRVSAGGSARLWKAVNLDATVTRGTQDAWAMGLGGRVVF